MSRQASAAVRKSLPSISSHCGANLMSESQINL
jgi:hypothetical protein